MSLNGLEILLAGGSGGLGAPTARLLAADSADLTVTYRHNEERARELADVARIERMDLSSAEDRARVLESLRRLYGVVIFAGQPARVSSPDQLEEASRASFENNFLGPILLAREAAGFFYANGISGAIVLVATMQAVHPFPASTAYASAKAALVHAAKVLAKETRGRNYIRVNVVAPGVIDAGMAQASIASGKYQSYLDDHTIPRYGRPEDVARVVRLLLEPDNYITGQVITVDGGLTL
jgi:3-oxoacyl-[acyl-carrier protein] reductase